MNKEAEILKVIKAHIEVNGFSPTIREIAKQMKIKSTSTIFHHLRELESLGLVARQSTLSRAMILTDQGEEVIKAYEIIRHVKI
ncbi:transcriptional repressor, LexA family [Alkaliphilus metalliredigens QYMF]|uniref:Transcriptional repressor, LexA family n=1 Tax=Alkaliphilus metalliredigens (strain QYMF) TaxID=293826 RepID=A6TP02_ALKMQ|nr:ArsR family transcriptional regulator [Alkaliphilus metalliredigens]ABR47920.1 transcriptional repressor, LexA family [Alkaliphilus metalliredigens QYMF]